MEAAAAGNIALEFNHALLVASRVGRVGLETPAEEIVGVVGLEVGAQNAKSLTILGDLVPVALDILQVLGEVGVAALKDLPVELGVHDGLEVDVLLPGLVGVGENKVRGLLDGSHEGADLVRVLRNELFVSNVEDGAEAAAAELGQLVDAEHLDVRLVAALAGKPLLQLDHLDVLQANSGVNVAVDDGLGDVHAAANGGVVGGSEAVVRGELVDLDLAKLAYVADSLALERAEVGCDARVLEVDNTSEGLVQKTSDGEHGEVASLGLYPDSQKYCAL